MIFYLVTISILLIYLIYSNFRTTWEAAVFVFVTGIMQNYMVPAEMQFLGFIDQKSIVAIILIITVLLSNSRRGVSYRFLDDYKKIALFLGIFLIIFVERYIEFKNGILFGDLEIFQILKRLLRDSINLFAVYHIIRRMYFKNTLNGLENGILFGLIISITSMIFPEFFISHGFDVSTESEEGYSRLTGFLGLDPNEASGVFNIIYGYILARIEKNRRFSIKYIVFVTLLIIGLFIVASLTGLVAFIFITLLFIIRNSKEVVNTLRNSFVIIAVSAILFIFFGDLLFERASLYQTGERDSLESRQIYWRLYVNDIVENPDYLLVGNHEEPTYQRSVHNAYISYLFYSGIFSLSIILYIMWKFYRYRNKYHDNYMYYMPIYSLFALLITWMTVVHVVSYWFILIMAASPGIPYYKLNIHYTRKISR